ncbi:MAG: hypothetical protein A3F40_02310 [Chlamydiae bacterium RIFCSPHIGHO2_12_FULL_27_8]|nr:MAG: hypothetical protein A3F40_02310 [Chlamydiae bacterium RIFCSPHIGHO2_12_FULL_27_8]
MTLLLLSAGLYVAPRAIDQLLSEKQTDQRISNFKKKILEFKDAAKTKLGERNWAILTNVSKFAFIVPAILIITPLIATLIANITKLALLVIFADFFKKYSDKTINDNFTFPKLSDQVNAYFKDCFKLFQNYLPQSGS